MLSVFDIEMRKDNVNSENREGRPIQIAGYRD